MAPPTPNIDMADQLVASLLPPGIPAPKLRKYKDVFSRKLRVHNYGRTNQFDVAARLDGLQERFLVSNNDELADAINTRLVKLKHHSDKWLPDLLDLLLRLSDNPTSKTRIEWLGNIGASPAVVPSLTWAEIEADEPIDRRDQIWRVAEYSDLSSDDDAQVEPTAPTTDNTVPVGERQEIFSLAKFEPVAPGFASKAVDCLSGDQFWKNVSDESFELTELQVIREVLFMIQGFPTALFWKVGHQFEIDQRYSLKNNSRETFMDVLYEFVQLATSLDLLRNFLKKAQPERSMQTLRSFLERTLQQIDSQLQSLEQDILGMKHEAAVTVLQLSARVGDITAVTGLSADLIAKMQSQGVGTIECLELLFERVCQIQAGADEQGYLYLSRLFFKCFDTYFRPLRDWMNQGTLQENQTTIFITASNNTPDLSALWRNWYELADDCVANRCPKFLRSVKVQIFNIGKTAVFLQFLNAPSGPFEGSPVAPLEESVFSSANPLLPFAELFAAYVQDLVKSRLQIVTGILREHLGNNCGLWKTLDALDNIYFGRNGYINDLVDTKVFTSIDRCDKNWSDHFLLGDLIQTVFEPVKSVEVERLAVKSSPQSSRNLSHRRQSVKLLKDLQIQYVLHLFVSNVITIHSLASYQRVSTFLTQIRRARYMLEHRSLFQVRGGRPDATLQERSLNQLLHHNLLLFTNILYNHLTSLVIEEAGSRLRQNLSDAADIDAMVAAHTKYCKHLEDACLTSKNLKPIRDAIISVLDLCIRFSDLNTPQTQTKSRRSSDTAARSFASATSHQRRRRRRNEEVDSASDDGEVESEDGEGYSTFIVPEESSLVDQLRKVRTGFEKHRSFVVAGLNSIGRVGGEQGRYWEILGSRLDWKRGRS
jgi:gamma-tubulin complex component 5